MVFLSHLLTSIYQIRKRLILKPTKLIMRSNVAQRILDETSEEVRKSVRKHTEIVLKINKLKRTKIKLKDISEK